MLTAERLLEYQTVYRPFYNVVKKYCPPPAKVIEIGCGGARLATCLSLEGYSVTATDLDESVLAIGRQNGQNFGQEMNFKIADALKLDQCFAPDSFDLATHHGVIEHFEKWEIHQMIQLQLSVAKWIIFGLPIKTEKNIAQFRGDNIYRNLWTLEQWRDDILLPFNIIEIFPVRHKSDDLVCIITKK